MVLFDLRQGFPCAFLISNKSDQEVLKIFFQSVRDVIKTEIKPKVFISDMAKVYFNAWLEVMTIPEHRYGNISKNRFFLVNCIKFTFFMDFAAAGM